MYVHIMCGSRKFFQKGSNFNCVFLADDGREDPNTTISGPLLPASKTQFKWPFTGGLMVAQH